jgi:enoyl-CoA hydratase/carnithine racemase
MNTLLVLVNEETAIARVTLNRPSKLNAMNNDFWREIKETFISLSADNRVRVVILDANGKLFSAGLDLKDGPSFDYSGKETSRSSIDIIGGFPILKLIV